ncbi:glycoside hydrolase family 95 protein [uncultured Muribaculum sp.]|uniref:glycoside hydrolase family 95 protein n=1 Tax=uncultured Muribaculum sp. TaxID=1918613 RepID=UPI00261C4308|nr:glycoside hydrolase family 95 protein [uncultured Muribaculum sp.]
MRNVFAGVAIVSATVGAYAGDLVMHYDRPARYFEEALVIGNGKLGATVYGGIEDDRLSLNDITLWTGMPEKGSENDLSGNVGKVRRLLDAEDYAGAENANKSLQGHYSENYQPLGNLRISYGTSGHGAAGGFYRGLDISEAVATTRSQVEDGTAYTREYLASSPDSVIAIRVTASGNRPLEFSLGFDSQLPHEVSWRKGSEMVIDGYAAAHSYPVYYGAVPDSLKHEYDEDRGIRFRTIVGVDAPQSRIAMSDGRLTVKGGLEATILISNETSFNGFDKDPVRSGKDYKAIAGRNIDNAAAKSFEEIRSAHVSDYKRLFGRVSLDLGETDRRIREMPTDMQLRLYTDSLQSNPELEALYFQFGRYLLISSSRTPGVPANLQGLWNEKLLPPWSCNYTTNINLEENYWPAENTNLPELHMPLLDFIGNLATNGRDTARKFYGVERGWCLGHNSDIWAMTNPVGLGAGDPMWASWNMGGAWLASHIWEHYAYTLDRDFLARYYPYLKGAAEFCIDWLVEKDGVLTTSPGTSPENRFLLPDGHPVATSYGTTSDNAMIRQCLMDAGAAAKTLGVDSGFIAEADSVLRRLAPYRIGKKGSLQEWWHDWEESEPAHRHQSHLYGLYPGNHIRRDSMPEIADACHRTLELRGPDATGWSTGWRVNLYSRLGDGEMAYTIYRRLLKYISPDEYVGDDAVRGGGTYPNLLDAHSPFQIDGNFGGTAGVAEMLVQSTMTDIYLLPALPAQWRDGSVAGLRARGGFTVGIDWKNGAVVSATIGSEKGGCTKLHFNGTSVDIELKPGETRRINALPR